VIESGNLEKGDGMEKATHSTIEAESWVIGGYEIVKMPRGGENELDEWYAHVPDEGDLQYIVGLIRQEDGSKLSDEDALAYCLEVAEKLC
jgi:hypothetical protein